MDTIYMFPTSNLHSFSKTRGMVCTHVYIFETVNVYEKKTKLKPFIYLFFVYTT